MCEFARDKHAEKVALDRIEEEHNRQQAVKIRDRLNAENTRRIAAIERHRRSGASNMTLERAQAELKDWQAMSYKKRLAEVAPV